MRTNHDVNRCLLCHEAPCTKACPRNADPQKGLLALRLENGRSAGSYFNRAVCAQCTAPCTEACVIAEDSVPIQKIAMTLEPQVLPSGIDLSMRFLGIQTENPFFIGSSVIASSYEMIARAFDMGWAGAYYKTISFMDIHEVSPRFDAIDREEVPFMGLRNMEQLSERTPEEDFEIISRLKKDYPKKIIAASIMGRSDEEWTLLAKMAQEAGADLIECNFSCPQMSTKGTGSDVGQDPELVRQYTKAVREGTTLPVIAKMTPNITHITTVAAAALEGGANGISAINTIKSISFSSRAMVEGKSTISGYSGKAVKPIAERMILEIGQEPATKDAPLSGIGGIETWKDALEFILLGCGNLQVVTSVMQYGYRIIEDLKTGLACYMEENGLSSLEEIRGSARSLFVSTDELNRTTFAYPKFDTKKCVGCGRCFLSCRDGGHHAIEFDPDTRRPRLIGKNCVGCHLCLLVCPEGAIGSTKRISRKQSAT